VATQSGQVSNQARIYAINPKARSRFNACYIAFMFGGQMTGSSTGSKVFLDHGWRAFAGLTMGITGFSMLVLFLRGPMKNTKTWIGWRGEWTFVKEKVVVEEKKTLPESNLEDGVDEKVGEDILRGSNKAETDEPDDKEASEKSEKTDGDEPEGKGDAHITKIVD